MVVRDVRTRWNYTHAMIRRALLLQEVIVICSCERTSPRSSLTVIHRRSILGFLSRQNFRDASSRDLTGQDWNSLLIFSKYVHLLTFVPLRRCGDCAIVYSAFCLGFYASNITNVPRITTNNPAGPSHVREDGASSTASVHQ